MTGAPWNLRWTTDRDDLLRALVADGLSAAQIAAEMGGTTRCAVLGRMGRIKVKSQNPPSIHKGSRPGSGGDRGGSIAIGIKSKRNRLTKHPPTRHSVIKQFPDEAADLAIEPAQRMSVFDLENDNCRWPCGEGATMFFCGDASADLAGGRPYCPGHSVRAVRKTGSPDLVPQD